MRPRLQTLLVLVAAAAPLAVGQAASRAPRIFLDSATLATLVARAKSATPQWQALRAACQLYLTGTVSWPDGLDYPDGGSIGEGYQGSGYFAPLMNVGLCYRTSLTLAPAEAAQYAAKGVDILNKMSAPTGPHSVDPLRDSGYGIRFYGLGMAVGYDWFYPALSATLKTRVITALNRWIDAFEHGGFGYEFPQGNYFAGYYAAKGVAALATEGDNTAHPTQWQDWLTQHRTRVQPYYAANLSGGGWPEGWNYGPLGVLNMVWPVLAAKSAKGMDLIGAADAPFQFPLTTAKFMTWFAWPDLLSMDDSNAVYDADNPTATQPFLYVVAADLLRRWKSSFAPYAHGVARAVRAVQPPGALGPDWDLWMNFLFWDEAAPEQDYRKLPLSYRASGMDEAALRSSWETGAVWAAFKGGPHVNYVGSGEEYFDKGSLAIRNGNRPLLVNAPAALLRNTPGTGDGSDYWGLVYEDNFTDTALRSLYNVVYTDRPVPQGQGSYLRLDGARTRLRYFDDRSDYVFLESIHLEDQYPRNPYDRASTMTLANWTRDVLYLRPGTFVIYDRTGVTDASVAHWLHWHFARAPVATAAPAPGVRRWTIGTGTTYAGTVQTLWPSGHTVAIVDVFAGATIPGSDPPRKAAGHKVYRLVVRPPATTTVKQRQWLTVVDAATNPQDAAPAKRLSAADGGVELGSVLGVLLSGSASNRAVLMPIGQAALTGPLRYVVPAAATLHVLTGLKPNTGYAVTVTTRPGRLAIDLGLGSGRTTTATGILSFRTTASGQLAPD